MTITVHTPINTALITESLSEALAEAIYLLYNTNLNDMVKKEDKPDEDSNLQQKV